MYELKQPFRWQVMFVVLHIKWIQAEKTVGLTVLFKISVTYHHELIALFLISFVSVQERLQEIPTQSNAISEGNLFAGGQEANALPGSEFDHLQNPSSQVCLLSLGVCMHAIVLFEYSGSYSNFHFVSGLSIPSEFPIFRSESICRCLGWHTKSSNASFPGQKWFKQCSIGI